LIIFERRVAELLVELVDELVICSVRRVVGHKLARSYCRLTLAIKRRQQAAKPAVAGRLHCRVGRRISVHSIQSPKSSVTNGPESLATMAGNSAARPHHSLMISFSLAPKVR